MYYIYMLRCIDNSIYTGITTDLERRINEHKTKNKKCAKYTKTHEVLYLEIAWQTNSKKNASKLEYYIKQLKKEEKEELIINKELDIFKEKINLEDYKLCINM